MSKRVRRLYCVIAVITVLGLVVSGCTQTPAPVASPSPVATTEAVASVAPTSDAATTLPLPISATPLTLTYWCALPEDAAASVTNFGDSPLYKELAKQTGITLKFTHPTLGQEEEQFNLVVASGELPDIMEWDFVNKYPGGASKAILDNVIVPLNDLITNYAPNLNKILTGTDELNKTIRKMMMTDDGKFFTASYLMMDNTEVIWHGPQIRKDFLDDLGLAVPTTIDDWTNMLTQFRDKKNCPAPFSVLASPSANWLFNTSNGGFAGAYGVCTTFYLDGSTIKYGPIQPGYKDYLTLLANWYQQKLFDQDFATQDRKTLDARVTSGQVGSYIGNTGGSMGRYLDALATAGNTTIKLVGAPWPVLKKGDVFKFGQKDLPVVPCPTPSITTSNKHQKESMMLLDYGYSEAGHMLFNFGILGESYTMVDGFPTYTDKITKNPDGLTTGQALSVYMRSVNMGPFVSDERYFMQYGLKYPEQKAAIAAWSNPGLASAYLPPISPTPEDSKVVSTAMNDVQTYTQEMFYKFVMGQEPMSNFDAYVAKVQGMGIDKVLTIYTAALDRYNKR